MYETIVNIFRDYAETNTFIQSFKYGLVRKSLGVTEDKYPLLFLENPITTRQGAVEVGVFTVMVNFQVLLTPQAEGNKYNVVQCQSIAEKVAESILLKMRADNKARLVEINPKTYSITPVMEWYDDKSAGVRVSVEMVVPNPLTRCDVDEFFDPEKRFDASSVFSDMNLDEAVKCDGTGFSQTKFPKIEY